jgi:transposase
MKRDGRGFDHRTLEAIRRMAVERVREGERPSSVVASFGFSRTTIYKWINAASKPGVGLKALCSRPATGRPRSLTPRQEQRVFRWINGQDPRQYGRDFGLWTRSVVASLIEQKFGIRLGVTAVGALLAKLGLTPQKPLQRAYQRDPQAIERWQRESFPAIAKQAKASGGEVYFWDESGFRADTVHGKTWGVKGQTPVVDRPGQRPSWPATVHQRRFRGERPRRILVLHLPRRPECRTVRHSAEADVAAPPQARAPGSGRTSGAQDCAREGLCCIHRRDADATFSSRLCA